MAGGIRDVATGAVIPTRRRYGLISILLAFAALFTVILAFVVLENLPEGTSEDIKSFASGATVIAFVIVAPLLHAVGFGFGVAGLVRPQSGKVSSVVGILLNVGLFGLGVGLVYLTAGALTAFR